MHKNGSSMSRKSRRNKNIFLILQRQRDPEYNQARDDGGFVGAFPATLQERSPYFRPLSTKFQIFQPHEGTVEAISWRSLLDNSTKCKANHGALFLYRLYESMG